MLYRWESQVQEDGNRIEKLEICRYVVNEYQSVHEKSLPIHDIDINCCKNYSQLPQNGFTILRKSIK